MAIIRNHDTLWKRAGPPLNAGGRLLLPPKSLVANMLEGLQEDFLDVVVVEGVVYGLALLSPFHNPQVP